MDWKRSRWPDAKFEVAGAKCALRNDRSPAQSFARSLTHSLAREKRDERGSRPRKTTTTRRREKREERREKSEERRERREERREKREDRRETQRGRQRSPNEAARGPNRGRYGTEKGRPLGGQREESREKGEERRDKIATSSTHCISTVPRAHLREVMKISRGHRNCRKIDWLNFYSAP